MKQLCKEEAVQIKRRIPKLNLDLRPIPGKYKEVLEEATIETPTKMGALVRLTNGDVIFRKGKDIVQQGGSQ